MKPPRRTGQAARTSYRSLGTCPTCGKQCYSTRSEAKRAARTTDPSAHFSAYRCISGYWHFGKLATPVSRGTASRDGSRDYPPHTTEWAQRKRQNPS